MTTVENLHEVFWNDSDRDLCYYQFETNRELTKKEIKLIESVIANVLNNKGKEEY